MYAYILIQLQFHQVFWSWQSQSVTHSHDSKWPGLRNSSHVVTQWISLGLSSRQVNIELAGDATNVLPVPSESQLQAANESIMGKSGHVRPLQPLETTISLQDQLEQVSCLVLSSSSVTLRR